MNLQRTDARRQIDDPRQPAFVDGSLYPFHQCVDAKAQVEIKYRRAIFNQEVLVAGLAIHDLYLPGPFRNMMQDGSAHALCVGQCRPRFVWLEIPDHRVLRLLELRCLFL